MNLEFGHIRHYVGNAIVMRHSRHIRAYRGLPSRVKKLKEGLSMKKVILMLVVIFAICTLTYAESISNTFPTAFSCVIEEEYIKDGISKEKNNFNFYQIDTMFREAFGIAYILDDNKKMVYELYIGTDIYSENKMKNSAMDVLNYFGIGFLNPQYNKVEDTGKTEIINGYECKVVKIVNKKEKLTKLIWQATALGNIGLKYEESDNKTKTIKIVKELNTDFKDSTVFNLPQDGKANQINVK
jgi:poly(A) polymerase Pap1